MIVEKNSFCVFIVYKRYGLGGYYTSQAEQAIINFGVNPIIIPSLNIFHLISIKSGDIVHIQFPEELYKSKYKTILIFKFLYKLFILYLLRLKQVKIFWTLHDELPHEFSEIPKLDLLMRAYLYKSCSVIFVHNKYANKIALKNKTKAILKEVPLGNMIGWFPNENITKNKARQILDIPPKAFLYLYFGRMRSYKGVNNLIECFKSIKGNNLRLVLAGIPSGSNWDLESTVKQLNHQVKSDKRIILRLEWIPKEEVAYYFNAADVVVLPFNRITTSASLITALSFGKPVIASNVGSNNEFIDSSVGILYSVYRKQDLINSLKFIRKKDLMKLSKNAYNKAKLLSWYKFGKITVKAYLKT